MCVFVCVLYMVHILCLYYIISYGFINATVWCDIRSDSIFCYISCIIQYTDRERDSKQFFAKLTVIFTLGEDEGHHWRCLSFLGDNQQEEIWQTVVIRRQEMVDKQSKTVAILGRFPPFLQAYLDVHSRYLQVVSGWCCCLVSQALNGYKWNKPFWRT